MPGPSSLRATALALLTGLAGIVASPALAQSVPDGETGSAGILRIVEIRQQAHTRIDFAPQSGEIMASTGERSGVVRLSLVRQTQIRVTDLHYAPGMTARPASMPGFQQVALGSVATAALGMSFAPVRQHNLFEVTETPARPGLLVDAEHYFDPDSDLAMQARFRPQPVDHDGFVPGRDRGNLRTGLSWLADIMNGR